MANMLSNDQLIEQAVDAMNDYSDLLMEFNELEIASNHSIDWQKKFIIPILPDAMTKEDLTEILSIYGNLESCEIKTSDRGFTCAHVKFVESNDALRAFEAANENEIQFNGTPIFLSKPYEKLDEQEKPQMETEDDNPEKIDFFNRLNDDCLEEIFSKLSILDRMSSSEVCRRWQEVLNDMWVKTETFSIPRVFVDEYNENKFIWSNEEWLTKVQNVIPLILTQYGSFLTCLEIVVDEITCRCRNVNFSTLIENHCSNIEVLIVRLGFSSKYRFLTSVSQLIEFSPNMLEKLEKLNVLKIDSFYLNRDEWNAICNKISLISLALTGCQVSGPINEIYKLSNLKYLNIAAFDNINLNDEFCMDLSNHCTNIEYLNISGSFCIKDAGIMAISMLPKLKVLIANNMKQITDKNFIYLSQLEELHCKHNNMLTTSGICKFISKAHNLKVLNLLKCPLVIEEIVECANSRVTEQPNGIPLCIIHESIVTKVIPEEKTD